MIVQSVTLTDGRVDVMLTNKQGISFANAQAVKEAARDAMRRIGVEGRIAIALVRAAKPRDVEGVDLLQLIKESNV